ncbi:V-type ATP synthase subunit A [Candidatus Woesearchaeota archaeon]|nr:V-type ATP synthase subunit A [Candidatus Woesearchaeota archaeon]
MSTGYLYRIAGPVVVARNIDAKMYDVVRVGKEKLIGEVIQIDRENFIIQVYEDTTGLKPKDPVETTGEPLAVELGPGLLGNIYDGIQRPLPVLRDKTGDFIARGATASALDEKRKWDFKAIAKNGDDMKPGQILGEVEEQEGIKQKILVPPDAEGKLSGLKSGEYTVNDVIGKVGSHEVRLKQKWPVRFARPVQKKLAPVTPLLTGQRVFDAFFPVAKGGAAAIPGPFGAGKTVSQQQLAKWCDADIIVYVGCGERGNEMTEVLTEFPELVDPKSGRPLMNRTVLIANTSNMPVAAREASIYTGITIAEYYRDQGYDVALMADSTSRWAEAMREISSRLEEMPGEEGYPAYLSTKLAEFYERAAPVVPLSGEGQGSVTVIGAVSPPGGDFSEPVTQGTLRVTKTFWALDAKLAQRRHFPAINWLTSYSLYLDTLASWFQENASESWVRNVMEMQALLQEEDKLNEIVQLVGSDALPARQQLILEVTRMIREFFLQQNAFHEVDTFCDLRKMSMMMETILHYYHQAGKALDNGVPLGKLLDIEAKNMIATVKFEKDYGKILKKAREDIDEAIDTAFNSVKEATA